MPYLNSRNSLSTTNLKYQELIDKFKFQSRTTNRMRRCSGSDTKILEIIKIHLRSTKQGKARI